MSNGSVQVFVEEWENESGYSAASINKTRVCTTARIYITHKKYKTKSQSGLWDKNLYLLQAGGEDLDLVLVFFFALVGLRARLRVVEKLVHFFEKKYNWEFFVDVV
jgi:hypothetical protein